MTLRKAAEAVGRSLRHPFTDICRFCNAEHVEPHVRSCFGLALIDALDEMKRQEESA